MGIFGRAKNMGIYQEYNQVIKKFKAFGLPEIGLNGAKDKKILSSTVFIGE